MEDSCFARFAPIVAIATYSQAAQVLTPLTQDPNIQLWLPDSLEKQGNSQHYEGSLKEHLASIWAENQAFIFCLAAGAVVRLIAPLLKNKAEDPAVIVIDGSGNYVVSLCSGHQGKADLLSQIIARQLGAKAIVTGGSSAFGLPAIDTFGFIYGWHKGEGDWTGVMAAIAKKSTVQVIQESGSTLWQKHLPPSHPFHFGFSESSAELNPQARIWISPTKRKIAPKSDFPKVQWHPRVLWIGIGCERGTSAQLIETAIDETCKTYHYATEAIAGIASIDLKADEAGIIQVCQRRNLPFKTFTPQALKKVDVPTPSEIVQQEVGTPSVAEAAAILAGENLQVSKQIFKSDTQLGAVTVAIAQANIEYIGHTGRLYLVGIGPGDLNQITPAAQTAITEADIVIGYTLYLDLIESLKRPEQVIEASPITQEQQRAQRAIKLAQWGLTVAVVSSGDCGIYGMAGLVLEELQEAGWNGKSPQVRVFPGISALQSAASRVGAPLMHDFCAISLSDLLTPWEVIQKRLHAAASGDFITALYNPRSQKRTEQIVTTQAIFVQHRQEDTPVAIVRGAYRQDEQVTITTLSQMLEHPIDMLTTVIIGNTTTRNYADWMITPRGYLDRTRNEE
ncbi:precorrin-3B C(17)-methyltransferase [Waterburya agarophytonicola K14]|uniref:Precorrin-3B C(17)-methyltransferase n=1 Tax=Waterburya agarophytonicola KI4 TaxID=2874699 RepID=A0A964BR81_9CYAN|nr:precorrin-3B C(17)-methyltransferase [Waterburya agarophytonicola KI4]